VFAAQSFVAEAARWWIVIGSGRRPHLLRCHLPEGGNGDRNDWELDRLSSGTHIQWILAHRRAGLGAPTRRYPLRTTR
jgi:hypothetical protein